MEVEATSVIDPMEVIGTWVYKNRIAGFDGFAQCLLAQIG